MPRPVRRSSNSDERLQDQIGVPLPRRRDRSDEEPSLDFAPVEDATKLVPGGAPSSSPHTESRQYMYLTSSSSSSLSRKNFKDLPQELKVKIIQLFLSPYNVSSVRSIVIQRERLLRVSRGVRKLVIDTPTLWTHISVSGPQTNHNHIKKCLRLAKDSDLWWVFDFRNHMGQQPPSLVADEWCTPEVVDSLFTTYLHPKMRKTTHLHIIVDSPLLFPVLFAKLPPVPAPVLRELKVVRGEMEYSAMNAYQTVQDPDGPMQDADPWFGGNAPELALVQVHYIPALFMPSIIKNLMHFTPSNVQYLDLSMQKAISPETFYGLLNAVAPKLQTLVLRNAGPMLESTPTTPVGYSSYLPSLKRLIVGKMTSLYLKRLLSTLFFPPVACLGLHGVSAQECDATWDVLRQHVPRIPLSHDRGSPSLQDIRAFGQIETLELFDMIPSKRMRFSQPSRESRVKMEALASNSSTKNSFSEFLASSSLLTEIRMRRVGIEFVTSLQFIPSSSHPYLHSPTPPLPAPALERLEVSCVTRLDPDPGDDASDEGSSGEEGECLPVKPKDLASALVSVLRSRSNTSNAGSIQQSAATEVHDRLHGIRRVHLDGEEWKSRHDPNDTGLCEALVELGAPGGAPAGELTWKPPREKRQEEQQEKEGWQAPILHWDARAPFFADYYDSAEI